MNEGILRILITQKCMYNCFFCHKEGVNEKKDKKLNKDDIVFLFKVYNSQFNKNAIRFSGGEPLERDDIEDIFKFLYRNGASVRVTTNGYLLNQKESICKYLKKINISIHSLDKEKYKKIINRDVDINDILNSIKSIREKYPDLDIIIDVTLVKGINTDKDDILGFIELAKRLKIKIKFVELFLKKKDYLYEIEKVKQILKDNNFVKKREFTRKVEYKNGDTTIYLAKCFCNIECNDIKKGEFCNKYNDLFITPDGKIRICRLKDTEIDILQELKEKNEEKLLAKLNQAYDIMGKGCLAEEENVWN